MKLVFKAIYYFLIFCIVIGFWYITIPIYLIYLLVKRSKNNDTRTSNIEYTSIKPNRANENKNIKGSSIDIEYNNYLCNDTFVVIDFETTGLNASTDEIIEISAVKYINGAQVGDFNTLVNPKIHIPSRITSITGIDDNMVEDCPTIDKVMPKLFDFINGFNLVAHNASFDMGFLKANMGSTYNAKFNVIDTLSISRELYPKLPNHKLETIKNHLGINIESHRANCDTLVTAKIYLEYCDFKAKKNEELVKGFSDDELRVFNCVRDILLKNNKRVEYLRYSHTGSYFDINVFSNILRIKMSGKKQYIISKLSPDELKLILENATFENTTKSETGETRIIINSINQLLEYIIKLEAIIISSFDSALDSFSYYRQNVKSADRFMKEYLSSELK